MPKKNLTWLIALALVLATAGAYVVVGQRDEDGKGGRKTEVVLPTDPIDEGRSEPERVRVHVDNSGPQVSVSVRTPEPWTENLDFVIDDANAEVGNPIEVSVDHEGWSGGPCATLSVDAEPGSLLGRVSFPRRCLPDSSQVTASVRVDGGKRVKASATRTERPNILMIMVDDMRTDELQWMPSVQKLIGKQGVTFTNGFAGYPLCCPARASVLTGLYPHNHGVWSHEPPWGFSSLQDADTVPVWL
jgi:hypothetical protein